MQEVKIKDKAKLILSKELQAQVTYLHHKVGRIEWSGVLFAKKIAGDISDPKTLVYKAEYIFPMDIGNAAYTEFNYTSAVMDMFDVDPTIGDYKVCGMHTHHNMDTFFSGTDQKELHDNAPNHNYYISLIVNFACDPKAKIAIKATEESGFVSYKGSNGEEKVVLPKRDILMVIDCEIEYEVDSWLETRLEQIVAEKRRIEATKPKPVVTSQIGKSYAPNKPLYGGQVLPQHSAPSYIDGIDEDLEKARQFLTQWLSGNINCKQTLDSVIADLDRQYKSKKLTDETFNHNLESAIDKAFDNVFTEFDSPYVIFVDCGDVLEEYMEKYPFLEVVTALMDSYYNRPGGQ